MEFQPNCLRAKNINIRGLVKRSADIDLKASAADPVVQELKVEGQNAAAAKRLKSVAAIAKLCVSSFVVNPYTADCFDDGMTTDDPVSIWIDELKQGDNSAARKLWNHFVSRLYEAARRKLRADSQRVYDEHDAAQSAFYALCAGVAAGRFPDLNDRTSLWRLLMVITSRKVSNRHRFDHREQRDVRRTNTDSIFLKTSDSGLIEKLPARDPTPEFETEFLEICGTLFETLDPQLQRIGWLKIEGYGDQEIADQLGCTRRTIQRKVERIRRAWEEAQKEG